MEITKEKINNIIDMFESQDSENKILGFEMVNALYNIKNVVGLLLIYKKVTTVSTYDWGQNCPSFYNNVIVGLNSRGVIRYSDIAGIINKNTSVESLELFKEDVEEFLLKGAKKAKIDFIDSLSIDMSEYIKKLIDDKSRISS